MDFTDLWTLNLIDSAVMEFGILLSPTRHDIYTPALHRTFVKYTRSFLIGICSFLMGPTMPRATRVLTWPLLIGKNEFTFEPALNPPICLACFETCSVFSFLFGRYLDCVRGSTECRVLLY